MVVQAFRKGWELEGGGGGCCLWRWIVWRTKSSRKRRIVAGSRSLPEATLFMFFSFFSLFYTLKQVPCFFGHLRLWSLSNVLLAKQAQLLIGVAANRQRGRGVNFSTVVFPVQSDIHFSRKYKSVVALEFLVIFFPSDESFSPSLFFFFFWRKHNLIFQAEQFELLSYNQMACYVTSFLRLKNLNRLKWFHRLYHHGHSSKISNNRVMSRKKKSVPSCLLVFLPPAEKQNLTWDQSQKQRKWTHWLLKTEETEFWKSRTRLLLHHIHK